VRKATEEVSQQRRLSDLTGRSTPGFGMSPTPVSNMNGKSNFCRFFFLSYRSEETGFSDRTRAHGPGRPINSIICICLAGFVAIDRIIVT
jgi:hypothetical protein